MKNEIIKFIDYLDELQEEKYKVSRELKGIHDELGEWNLGLSHGYMDVVEKLSELLIKNEENGGFTMNYYEISDPYYALIKANSEGEAVDLYIAQVAGDEGDRASLIEEVKLVNDIHAGFKVGSSDIDKKEASELFKTSTPQVVLVDSSLL